MGERFFFSACLLLAGFSHAATEIRGTATTDYLQRGLQQNNRIVAYQGLLEYEFDNGLFLGVWASSVDFAIDDRNFEFDYFAGYSRKVSPALAFDATIIRYTYPGHSKPHDYNWTELMVSAYVRDRWLFSWGVADNWLSLDKTTTFVEGGYRYPLPLSLTLDMTIGRQSLAAPFPDYTYGELGISRRLGALDVRVGYSVTDDDAQDWFRGWADNRWLASISYAIRP